MNSFSRMGIIVIFLLAFSSLILAEECGNPWLLNHGAEDDYCDSGSSISEPECCFEDSFLTNALDSDDYYPDNEADCENNFYGDDNSNCEVGCCLFVNNLGCNYMTKYRCLADSGSTGEDWGEGFSNSPNPCYITLGNGDNLAFFDGCDSSSLTCDDFDSSESCGGAGCSWCDNSCVSSCNDCEGMPVRDSDGVCGASASICSVFDVYSNCNSNGCYWCDAGVDTKCFSDCDNCPSAPDDNDGDGICDEDVSCSGETDRDNCRAKPGCGWCDEPVSGGADVCVPLSCNDCQKSYFYGGECQDSCGNDVDETNSFSGKDDDDICCQYAEGQGVSIRNEDKTCVPSCTSDEMITDSTEFISVAGEKFCQCAGILFNLDENPTQYCCGDSAPNTPCQKDSLTICLYDDESENQIHCGEEGVDCSGVLISPYSANNIELFLGELDSYCTKIEGLFYPQEVSLSISANSLDVAYMPYLEDHNFDGESTFNINLRELDMTCFESMGTEVSASVKPLSENEFDFSWDFLNRDDVSCLDLIDSVTVSYDSISIVKYNPQSNFLREIDFNGEDSKTVTFTFEISCAEGDNGCNPREEVVSIEVFPSDDDCVGKETGVPFCANVNDIEGVYSCDEQNKVQLEEECVPFGQEDGEYCSDARGSPICTLKAECILYDFESSNVFGMFPESSAGDKCEVEGDGDRKFCYLDFSDTAVDACYACAIDSSCYDYSSEASCGRDNCNRPLEGVLGCNWYDGVFAELGFGTCYSKGYNGTDHCGDCHYSNELYSNVGCTQDVCDLLGACYTGISSEKRVCHSCEGPETNNPSSCYDFLDEASCVGSPGRNPSVSNSFSIVDLGCNDETGYLCNEVFSYSYDACGLGRCAWIVDEGVGACVKDGNFDGIDDCTSDECKKDSFPSKSIVTSVSPSIIPSNGGTITIEARKSYSFEAESGARLFYCFGVDCIPHSSSSSENLIFEINVGNENLPENQDDETEIRFFSVDENENVEEIQTFSFPFDTLPPDISFLTEIDNENGGYSFNLITDSDVECSVCLIETGLAGSGDLEGCMASSNSWQALDDYPIQAGESVFGDNFLPLDYHSVFVKCEDMHSNSFNYETIVDLGNHFIRAVNPGLATQQKFNSTDLILSFQTRSQEMDCSIQSDSFQSSSYSIVNGVNGDRIWTDGEGSYLDYNYSHPFSASEGFHSFSITCIKDSINDVFESSFVVDTTGPDSILEMTVDYVSSEVISGKNYFEFYPLRIRCNDSGNYGELDSFGCDYVEYCVADYGLSCVPDVSGESLVELSDGTFYSKIGLDEDGPFSICYNSFDKGGNVGEIECTNILIDGNAPELKITSPPLNYVYGKNEIDSTGAEIRGYWTDEFSSKVSISIKWFNSSSNGIINSVFPLVYEGVYDSSNGDYRGDFDPANIDLEPGINTILFTLSDDIDFNKNPRTIEHSVILDQEGPSLFSFEAYNNESQMILSLTGSRYSSEYGSPIIFNASLNDSLWSGEDLSGVRIEFECVGGYCEERIPLEHYFWMEYSEKTFWNLFLEPSSPDYSSSSESLILDELNNFDLFPGDYNITITAWDKWCNEDLSVQGNTIIPSTEINCNKNSFYIGNINIEDSKKGRAIVNFISPTRKSPETGLPVMGFMEDAVVQIFSIEPIEITSLNISLVDVSESFVMGADYLMASADKRTWNYGFSLPNLAMLEEFQDSRSGYDNNVEFLIDFVDQSGLHSSDLTNPRFGIDSLGTEIEIFDGSEFVSGEFSDETSELNFNFIGKAFFSSNYGHHYEGGAKISLGDSETVSATTISTASELIGGPFYLQSEALEGSNEIMISDLSPNCEDTGGIEGYIYFSDKDRENLHYYSITSVSSASECLNEGRVRRISFSPALEETIPLEGSFLVYSEETPKGFFEISTELDEGFNFLKLVGEDYIGNIGNEFNISLLADWSPPYIESSIPLDGEYIGENDSLINVTLRDGTDSISGVGIKNASFRIDHNFLFRSYFYSSTSGRANLVGGSLEGSMDVEGDVSFIFNPNEELEDGIYVVSINATDKLGHSMSESFSFTIDSRLPRKPSLDFELSGTEGVFDGLWYTRFNSSDFLIIFNESDTSYGPIIFDEVIFNETESLSCSALGGYRFRCSLPNVPDGKYPLLVKAGKHLEDGSATPFGSWRYDFIVDSMPPEIEVENLQKTKDYENVNVGGVASDLYLSYAEVSGDVLASSYQSDVFESGNFNVFVNLTSGEGEKNLIVKVFDIAGNSVQKEMTVEIDSSVPAIEDFSLMNFQKGMYVDPVSYGDSIYIIQDNKILLEGGSLELDTKVIPWIDGKRLTRYEDDVESVPSVEESFIINEDVCLGETTSFNYKLGQKLNILNKVPYDGISYLISYGGTTVAQGVLDSNDKSESFSLDEEGEYSLIFSTTSGLCDSGVFLNSDSSLNHKFSIEIPKSELREEGVHVIYLEVEDSLGNVAFTSSVNRKSFEVDRGAPTLENPYPSTTTNLLSNFFSFTIKDDIGVNPTSVIVSFNGEDFVQSDVTPTGATDLIFDEIDVVASRGGLPFSYNDLESHLIRVYFEDLAGHSYNDSWSFFADTTAPSEPEFSCMDGNTRHSCENYYFGDIKPSIEVRFQEDVVFPFVSAKVVGSDGEVNVNFIQENERVYHLNHSFAEDFNEGYYIEISAKRAGDGEFSVGGPFVSNTFFIDLTSPNIIFSNSQRLSNESLAIEGRIGDETFESMQSEEALVSVRTDRASYKSVGGVLDDMSFVLNQDPRYYMEGENKFELTATDKADNQDKSNWTITYDTTPPLAPSFIIDSELVDGSYITGESRFSFEFEVFESCSIYVNVNDQLRYLGDFNIGTYSSSVTVSNGLNQIYLIASDVVGNSVQINPISVFFDGNAPIFSIIEPLSNSIIGTDTPEIVSVRVSASSGIDMSTLVFSVNGENIPSNLIQKEELPNGEWILSCSDKDEAGRRGGCIEASNWNYKSVTNPISRNDIFVGVESFAGIPSDVAWTFYLDYRAPFVEMWDPSDSSSSSEIDPRIAFRFREAANLTSVKLSKLSGTTMSLYDDYTSVTYTDDFISYWFEVNEKFPEEPFDVVIKVTTGNMMTFVDSYSFDFSGNFDVEKVLVNGEEVAFSSTSSNVIINGLFTLAESYDIEIIGKASFSAIESFSIEQQVEAPSLEVYYANQKQPYDAIFDSETGMAKEFFYVSRNNDSLEDGLYQLEVKGIKRDLGGIESRQTITFIVDSTSPYIQVISPLSPTYLSTRCVLIEGNWGDEPDGKHDSILTLDNIKLGGVLADIYFDESSNKGSFEGEVCGLLDGENHIQLTAVDLSGNEISEEFLAFVESQGPSLEMNPRDLNWWEDSGAYVTSSSSALFDFTINREGLLQVFKESKSGDLQKKLDREVRPFGCVDPLNCEGMPYSFEESFSLSVGENYFVGNITDSFSLSDDENVRIIFDNTAPKIDYVDPKVGSTFGNPLRLVTIGVVELGSAIESIEFSVNGVVMTQSASFIDYKSFSFDGSVIEYSGLDEGANNIVISLTDYAGHTTPYSFTLNVDSSLPPFKEFISPDYYTNQNMPLISFSYLKKVDLFATVLDSNSILDLFETGNNFLFEGQLDGSLSDGTHEFSVNAQLQEIPGPESHDELSFIIDTTPPSFVLNEIDRIQPNCKFRITGSFEDDRNIGSMVAIINGPTSLYLDEQEHTFSGEIELPRELRNTNVTLSLVDMAGNSFEESFIFLCDSIPPQITFIPDSLFINTNSLSFSATANEESKVYVVVDEVESLVGEGDSFNSQIDLAVGMHEVYLKAIDQAGNEGESEHFTIVYDNTPPEVISYYPAQDDVVGNDLLEVGVYLSDVDSGLDENSITFEINSVSKTGRLNEAGAFVISTRLNEGENSVTLSAFDNSGNEVTASWTFTLDSSAPSFDEMIQPSFYTNNPQPKVVFRYDGVCEIVSVELSGVAQTVESVDGITYNFIPNQDFGEGKQTLKIRARSFISDSISTDTREFIIDLTPPTISFDKTSDYVKVIEYPTTGSVSENYVLDRILLSSNGWGEDVAQVSKNDFLGDVRLTASENLVRASAFDLAGNNASAYMTVYLDSSVPLLFVENLDPGMKVSPDSFATRNDLVSLSGEFFSDYLNEITFKEDVSNKAEVSGNSFVIEFISEGETGQETVTKKTLVISNKAGLSSETDIYIIKDLKGPSIELVNPVSGITNVVRPNLDFILDEISTECIAEFFDSSGDFKEVPLIGSGINYQLQVKDNLKENFPTDFTIRCQDSLGNSGEKEFRILVDTSKPEVKPVLSRSYLEESSKSYSRYTIFTNETKISYDSTEALSCSYGTSASNINIPFISEDKGFSAESEIINMNHEDSGSFYILCEDIAGNVMDSPYVIDYSVDLFAPIKVFDFVPDNYTNVNNPLISFKSYVSADCKISLDKDGSWTDLVTTTRISEGDYFTYSKKASEIDSSLTTLRNENKYDFKIECSDPEGLRNNGISYYSFTFDDVLDAPIIIRPFDDFIVDNSSVEVYGTTEEGALVTLNINGATQDSLISEEGSFSFNAYLSPGDVTIEVDVIDRAANEASSYVKGFYDSFGPKINSIVPLSGSILPNLDSASAYVEGDVVKEESSFDLFDSLDNPVLGSIYWDDMRLVFEPLDNLYDGVYYLQAKVVDSEGREAYLSSEFMISSGTPKLNLISPSDYSGVVTTQDEYNFKGDSESSGTITQFDFSLEGKEESLCESSGECDLDGYIAFDMQKGISKEGMNDYSFTLRNSINQDKMSLYIGELLKDSQGPLSMNINFSDSVSYPASSKSMKELSTASSRSEALVDFTNNRLPSITVRFDEPVVIENVGLIRTGESNSLSLNLVESFGDYYFIYEPSSELLLDGEYVFSVSASDVYGNPFEGGPTTRTFILDTTVPVIDFVSPFEGEVITQIPHSLIIESNEYIRMTYFIYNGLNGSIEDSLYKKEFKDSLNLEDNEESYINYTFEDYAGNSVSVARNFVVATKPLVITLVEPSYSVSPVMNYQVIINTSRVSSCRYDFLAQKEFSDMTNSFSTIDNKTHSISRVGGSKTIYINCLDKYGMDSKASYKLIVDQQRPIITSLSVYPTLITEINSTKITVSTDKVTICSYKDYQSVWHDFPGYGEGDFKLSHEVLASTPIQKGDYNFWVKCEDKGPLYTSEEAVSFEVDLSQLFLFWDNTKNSFTTHDILLNISTNKKADCYYGSSSESREEEEFDSNDDYTFTKNLRVLDSGIIKYYISCYTLGDSFEHLDGTISFVIDETEPLMKYVNVSNLEMGGNLTTFRTDRLNVRWLAIDNETDIEKYSYDIYKYEMAGGVKITSGETGDKDYTVTGLSLEDGESYYFSVKAMNGAGVWSIVLDSEKILVDKSKAPSTPESDNNNTENGTSASCYDNILNGDETDVDCGGSCSDCENGESCDSDSDCQSGSCEQGVCLVHCNSLEDLDCDGTLNEFDADIDGDGLVNWEDPDDDNDGFCDTLNSPLNDDSCHGVDDDDDGDGILDVDEQDTDNDFDNDDVNNDLDSDIDGDGLVNWEDPDDDNDGLPDTIGSPLNGDEFDGVLDDKDDDGDGILDVDEQDTDNDLDNNGTSNYDDADIDGDGLVNWEDPDDDNDGLPDTAGSPLNEGYSEDIIDDNDDGDRISDSLDTDSDNNLDNDNTINYYDDDIDGDGIPNDSDPDDDNDGILDSEDPDENGNGIQDKDEDFDGDGLPNGWESDHGLDPHDSNDGSADPDEDGLTNLEEYNVRNTKWHKSTAPNEADTDGDGWDDKKELEKGFNPTDAESHPKSIWLLLLLIIIIIAVLAVGGYYGYQQYLEYDRKQKRRPPMPTPSAMAPPQAMQRTMPNVQRPMLPPKKGKINIYTFIRSLGFSPQELALLEKRPAVELVEAAKTKSPKESLRALIQDKGWVKLGDKKDALIRERFSYSDLTKNELSVLRDMSQTELENFFKGKSKEQIKKALVGIIVKKKPKSSIDKLSGVGKSSMDQLVDMLAKKKDIKVPSKHKGFAKLEKLIGKKPQDNTYHALHKASVPPKATKTQLKKVMTQLGSEEKVSPEIHSKVINSLINKKRTTKEKAIESLQDLKKTKSVSKKHADEVIRNLKK